jgi:hypothetical protein
VAPIFFSEARRSTLPAETKNGSICLTRGLNSYLNTFDRVHVLELYVFCISSTFFSSRSINNIRQKGARHLRAREGLPSTFFLFCSFTAETGKTLRDLAAESGRATLRFLGRRIMCGFGLWKFVRLSLIALRAGVLFSFEYGTFLLLQS